VAGELHVGDAPPWFVMAVQDLLKMRRYKVDGTAFKREPYRYNTCSKNWSLTRPSRSAC
jgi:hypothetical protein